MQVATSLMLFAVLIPARIWVPPNQPININVKADGQVTLVLTDFSGKAVETKPATVAGGKEVDLRALYPTDLSNPGTYVLWAVPPVAEGKTPDIRNFVGTPLVIGVRVDKRAGMPLEPMVTRIDPLRYAVMSTEHGDITMAFYYDAAPNTVNSFLTLSEQGYYDGLTFHRIVPGFVIQGGDPRGDGTGGPGYHIEAEFNDKRHEEGVLSMARSGDPMEQQGQKPRPEYANSAGSQFFICLEYKQHLDGKYTAFGKATAGLDAVRAIAKVPLADPGSGRPEKPPVIKKIQVMPVTPQNNPYTAIMTFLQQDK